MAGRDRRKGQTNKTRDAVGVSAADAELFRRVLHDVAPLPGRDRRLTPVDPVAIPDLPAAPPGIRRAPAAKAGKAGPLPPLQPGVAVGVDRRSAERLRRGRMTVDARLDLHGYTQDQAHDAVAAFIPARAAAGDRCVLIVTGKGSLSQGGGVLRRRLHDWLNQAPCRGHILSTATARPQHGGDGALYVLLRRRRPNGA